MTRNHGRSAAGRLVRRKAIRYSERQQAARDLREQQRRVAEHERLKRETGE